MFFLREKKLRTFPKMLVILAKDLAKNLPVPYVSNFLKTKIFAKNKISRKFVDFCYILIFAKRKSALSGKPLVAPALKISFGEVSQEDCRKTSVLSTED